MKKFFTLIAAVFASVNMMAQEWGPNENPNVDCNGTDFSAYACKPNKLADGSANSEIFVGEALTEANGITTEADGNKCVTVLAAEGAVQDWDAQFWIVVPRQVEVGEKIHVKFDYKADFMGSVNADDEPLESVTIGTQAHGAPGDYHHWACIGDVNFTTEWQTYEYDITVSGDMQGSTGFQSVAFNLSQGGHDYNITYYFDNLEISYEKVDQDQVVYWKPVVNNSDLEGENTSNYIIRIYQQGDNNATPTDGVGCVWSENADGEKVADTEGRGIQIVVPAKVENNWDSQFFIKMNEPIPAGDLIKVEFDYRASENISEDIDTQSHGSSAGSYNHYTAIGNVNFTTEWKHYSYTQSVSSDQSKENNPYQHIAFDLSHFDHEVIFYLDNIVVKHKVLVPAGENPAQIALEEYIQQLESKYPMENLNSISANGDVREAFEGAYNDAQNAAEDDDFDVLLDALTAAESKFANSVKDYTNLQNYYNLIAEKKEQAEKTGYEDLADELDELIKAPEAALDAEELGREDINAMVNMNGVYDKVAAAVKAAIAPGADLSLLIKNGNYAWGNGYWNGSFTTRAKTGEKWHAAFNAYQTLSDMPKGAYTLTIKGFQRHDSNDAGETGLTDAVVYANSASKFLIEGSDESYADFEGDFPSSMEMAREAFDQGYGNNTLSFVMTEAGDLTLGVKGDNTLNWVIWSDWKLVYEGETSKAVLAAAIADAAEKADIVKDLLLEELNGPSIDKCSELTEAAAAMVDAIESTSDEDANAMIEKLIAIVTEMKDAAKLIAQVNTSFEAFQESFGEYEYTAAEDLVARAQKAMEQYDDFQNMTTDELKAYSAELAYLTDALKIDKDAFNATDENPADLTNLFVDPDFEDYAEVGANANYPGWSGSGFGTGGGTAGPVAERWNQSSGFNTYVDFAGLPEGGYKISVDGAYRTSVGEDWKIINGEAETDNEAFLYVNTSIAESKVALHNIAEGAMTAEEAEEAGIDVSANCSTLNVQVPTEETDSLGNVINETLTYYLPDQLYTADQWIQAGKYLNNNIEFKVPADGKARIGVTRKGAANDWCFLDNFTLMYYGKNSETAIAAIEVVKNDKGIYTINGIRVLDTKRSGLYIKNGKKLLVK